MINMWFLRGRPNSIDIQALIISVPGGYQETSYSFKVSIDPNSSEATTKDGELWVALAFPWASHKETGGFEIVNMNLLALLNENFKNYKDVKDLTNNDIKIYENPRALKKSQDIELVHVQELYNWHLDDTGIITTWIRPDQWYQINYRHKMAADSYLFLPTRLPTIISAQHPQVSLDLWVVNGDRFELPKHLKHVEYDSRRQEVLLESQETLDRYTCKEDWEWDDDTRIHTENWESSDDEDFESSEDDVGLF